MNNLLRLVYTSRSTIRFDDTLLSNLLEKSRSNNYHAGITGVLSFGNGYFLQVLEGPESALITLYSKIVADARHKDCAILDIMLTHHRLFSNWSMGFVGEIQKIGGHYNEMLDYRTIREDPENTRDLLNNLLEIIKE